MCYLFINLPQIDSSSHYWVISLHPNRIYHQAWKFIVYSILITWWINYLLNTWTIQKSFNSLSKRNLEEGQYTIYYFFSHFMISNLRQCMFAYFMIKLSQTDISCKLLLKIFYFNWLTLHSKQWKFLNIVTWLVFIIVNSKCLILILFEVTSS